MKKAFWITLGLFILSLIILIFKWELQEQQSILGEIYFIIFIIMMLMIKFYYITIIVVPLSIWLIVKFMKHTDNDILKTLVVSFFMLITAINLIGAIVVLFEKPNKEEIIDNFGGVDKMLAYAENLMVEGNSNIEFKVVKKELEKNAEKFYYDGDVEYPVLNYEFDVKFKDTDNIVYNGDLKVIVACGAFESCFIDAYTFENLQTEDGQSYNKGKETNEELLERHHKDDFNFWEMNPYHQ